MTTIGFLPLTPDALAACRAAVAALLRTPPRDLTPAELDAVLPPRGPQGTTQNRTRGWSIRYLNDAGFTVDGRRIR